MTWKAHGRIFSPETNAPWVHSHAQVPTPLIMQDRLRVFYAGRNAAGKSFIAYADFARNDPTKLLHASQEPILALGRTGTFDDEGMMPSTVVSFNDQLYFYYSGWNRRLTCPYHNATGLIVSDDGGNSFYRPFEGPVLDRIPMEPYLAVTPTILLEDGVLKMWYVSGVSWEKIGESYEPVYVIKHAYSSDGISWSRPGMVCVPQQHPMEAFSHPSVMKFGDVYRMWYCFRGSRDYRGGAGSYQMGYADSADGLDWTRKDRSADAVVPRSDWDSQMQCYPYVFEMDGSRFMLYNGNGFGKSGFGLAEWLD